MSFALVLDADRYNGLIDAGVDMDAIAAAWMKRIGPAAQAAGGMIADDGRAVVIRVRWVGDRYDVELMRPGGDPEDMFFWWTPPEPPPAELKRHARYAGFSLR